MNRTEATGLILFTTIAIGADAYFFVSRCECSPQLHLVGAAVALLVQGAAIAIPFAVNRHFHDSALKVRIRAFATGLFVCAVSLPLMETAVLFGDSVGRVKGFPSTGYTCDYSRVFPDGVPNKRVQATCETHAPDA